MAPPPVTSKSPMIFALRRRVALATLTVIEVPALELLKATGEEQHYRAFRRMTDRYFADFKGGDEQAVATMIDFYGGLGTFASWPPRVRAYAIETTPVNMLDWATAYGFALSPASLAGVAVPTLVLWGSASHPAMQCVNALLGECISDAILKKVNDAAHFTIATHAQDVGRLIADHVHPRKRANGRWRCKPECQRTAVSRNNQADLKDKSSTRQSLLAGFGPCPS